MEKSSVNGGPPSYASATAAEEAGAAASTCEGVPLPVSGVASMTLDNSNESVPIKATELPRGVTLKEATNPASVYSQTKVSLELPTISATKRIPGPPAQSAPLQPFLLQCTLFASYDVTAPHPVPFREAGCPATHSRGQPAATSKTKVSQSVSKLRKRLGVQIPLAYLGSPGLDPSQAAASSSHGGIFAYLAHPQQRNGTEMTARSGNVGRYRRVSLFQAQAREMTGIVSRPLAERVVSGIYAGTGIYSKQAVFPAETVLRYSNKSVDVETETAEDGEQKTGWLAKLKSKAKGKDKHSEQRRSSVTDSNSIDQVKSMEGVHDSSADVSLNVNSVKTAMVFATLDLLAPPPRLMETGGPYPIEMNKASDADLSTSARLLSEFDRSTDEDRFKKFLFKQTPADEQLCCDMLRALERRGAIWVEAGRLITPSSRKPNPRERARFLVKGVFPERFVYRCKYYRARNFEPMPNDLDAKEVKRFGAPLVVHTVVERTSKEGIDLSDHQGNTVPPSQDGDQEQLDWEWDEEDNLTFNTLVGGNEGGEAAPPDYTSTQKELLKGYGIESQRAEALIEAEQDFFRGWSIGVTEEPFKGGGWMESLGSSSSLWFAVF